MSLCMSLCIYGCLYLCTLCNALPWHERCIYDYHIIDVYEMQCNISQQFVHLCIIGSWYLCVCAMDSMSYTGNCHEPTIGWRDMIGICWDFCRKFMQSAWISSMTWDWDLGPRNGASWNGFWCQWHVNGMSMACFNMGASTNGGTSKSPIFHGIVPSKNIFGYPQDYVNPHFFFFMTPWYLEQRFEN